MKMSQTAISGPMALLTSLPPWAKLPKEAVITCRAANRRDTSGCSGRESSRSSRAACRGTGTGGGGSGHCKSGQALRGLVTEVMGGARRMAGVTLATPTSQLLPHQHFTLLPLLATPKAHQIYTCNVFGQTIFENDYPPMTEAIAVSIMGHIIS